MIPQVGSTFSANSNHNTRQAANGSDFADELAGCTGPASPTTQTSPSAGAAPSTVLACGLEFLFASPEEQQTFSNNLTQRLQAAGVDTSQNISLNIGSDGHVTAKAGTTDKEKIDAVFSSDPDLENEYCKIATTQTSTAIAKELNEYMHTNSNGSDAIWSGYEEKISAIKSASGQASLESARLIIST